MTQTAAVAWHESIAPSFHAGYSRSPRFAERFEQWRAAIARTVRPSDRVLDAGCGPGLFSFEAAGHGAIVDAIDGSPAMIEICRAQQAERSVGMIDFRVAMLDELRQWPAEGHDVVMCSSVLEYLPDLDTELETLARLLKPGGRMLVSMPNASSWYRRIERTAFRLTRRPRYYAHVHQVVTAQALRDRLARLGMQVTEVVYFAEAPVLSRLFGLLSARHRKTLFLAIATKAG